MTARRLRHGVLGAGALCFVAVAVALSWQAATRLPKRFAAVVPGQLYRSGSVSPAQLRRVHEEYGIRRVICLLNPAAAETEAERQAALQLGLEWQNVPLPGNGASTSEQRRQILALLTAPGAGPTLVNCAAGTNRSGLAIGLYRLHCQGWPLPDVLAELQQFGFEDGARHEDLRRALADEAALAAEARRQPAGAQPASVP